MRSPVRSLATILFLLVPTVHAATDAPQYGGGDAWSYQELNGFNGIVRGTFTQTVAGVASGEIRVDSRSSDGKFTGTRTFTAPGLLADGMLNDRATGRLEPALQLLPFPLEEGSRWRQSVKRHDPVYRQRRDVTIYGKVEGWENVKVPAGEFRALKIVRELYLGDHDAFRGQTRLTEHEWYVPDLKHWVKLQNWEEYHEAGQNVAESYYQGERQVFELLSFRPGAR